MHEVKEYFEKVYVHVESYYQKELLWSCVGVLLFIDEVKLLQTKYYKYVHSNTRNVIKNNKYYKSFPWKLSILPFFLNHQTHYIPQQLKRPFVWISLAFNHKRPLLDSDSQNLLLLFPQKSNLKHILILQVHTQWKQLPQVTLPIPVHLPASHKCLGLEHLFSAYFWCLLTQVCVLLHVHLLGNAVHTDWQVHFELL